MGVQIYTHNRHFTDNVQQLDEEKRKNRQLREEIGDLKKRVAIKGPQDHQMENRSIVISQDEEKKVAAGEEEASDVQGIL